MLCISALVFRKINQMTADMAPDCWKQLRGFLFSQPTGSIDGNHPADTAFTGGGCPRTGDKEEIDTGILRLSDGPGQGMAAKAAKKPE